MKEENNQKEEIGTTAGILIIVLMLFFGGFYFFGQRIEKHEQLEALLNQSASSTADASSSYSIDKPNNVATSDFNDLQSGTSTTK